MTKDKFDNLHDNILPLREEIYEDVISNVEENDEAVYDLTLSTISVHKYLHLLEAVIGRKAFTRRNNLFYDYD